MLSGGFVMFKRDREGCCVDGSELTNIVGLGWKEGGRRSWGCVLGPWFCQSGGKTTRKRRGRRFGDAEWECM